MVDYISARADVETLLTKTVIYYNYDTANKDLAYEVQRRGEPNPISINAQCTVQNLDSKYVEEGILTQGDLVGLFRYEYSEDTFGEAIIPVLVPKKGDEISFVGMRFIIKTCTPATSEDDEIFGWDFQAGGTPSP